MNDNYIELLILAYFKQYNSRYDLTNLKDEIGLSFKLLDEYIDKLIIEKKLEYKHYLLSLTVTGRVYLANSKMENYSFNADVEKMHSKEKLSLDTIYCIDEFSKQKWRGSKR